MSLDRAIVIHSPSSLEIGADTRRLVGDWAGTGRILVLTSPSVAPFVEDLGLTGKFHIHSGIPAEPDDIALAAAIAAAATFGPDTIIGLGGGSVLDIAKLVSVLWDGRQNIHDVIGPNLVAAKLARLCLVPTTAGTGSEAGIRALVTNSQTQMKMAVESPHMRADLAILDPVLTYSVPPTLTAATGIDAMAHCVEAFTNIRSHDLIDAYARLGFGLIGQYLRRAVRDGTDTQARGGLMLASYYGGVCLGPVNTAAGHSLAYPLGTRLKLPHGLANAIIFPHVLAFNQPVHPEKTNEVLIALGLGAAQTHSEAFEKAFGFCQDLGVDMSLSSHGAKASDLSAWATDAHAIRRLMDNNPREMSIEDVLQIYQAAF